MPSERKMVSNSVLLESEDLLEDNVGKCGEKDERSEESEAADALTRLTSYHKEEEDDEEDDEFDDFEIPLRFTRSGRKRATPFPVKLMKVLSMKEYSDIISWMPSGKSFMVTKPKAFTAEILPMFFKQAKYSSFTRKLHRWGFMRHFRGDESGAFYHEHFRKGDLDLAEKMVCLKADPPRAPKRSSPKRKTKSTTPDLPSPVPRTNTPSMMNPSIPMVRSMLEAREGFNLNVAIEIEVARRMKERQAALSRQALVFQMQQQQLQALQEERFMAISQQPQSSLWSGFSQQAQALRPAVPPPLGLQKFNMNLKFDSHMRSLPSINNPGAKTA